MGIAYGSDVKIGLFEVWFLKFKYWSSNTVDGWETKLVASWAQSSGLTQQWQVTDFQAGCPQWWCWWFDIGKGDWESATPVDGQYSLPGEWLTDWQNTGLTQWIARELGWECWCVVLVGGNVIGHFTFAELLP